MHVIRMGVDDHIYENNPSLNWLASITLRQLDVIMVRAPPS